MCEFTYSVYIYDTCRIAEHVQMALTDESTIAIFVRTSSYVTPQYTFLQMAETSIMGFLFDDHTQHTELVQLASVG